MQLNDLKPAWKQLKFLNSMQHIDSNEILSIIDSQENSSNSKAHTVLLKVVSFIAIIFFCQGG